MRRRAAYPILQTERLVLDAFTGGINAWMEAAADALPVEFDLLAVRRTATPCRCRVTPPSARR